MILIEGKCAGCGYAAKVGVGRVLEATTPVHWAPARCDRCGLVSVNIYSYGFDSEPACHECGGAVDLYVDWGKVPEPAIGGTCPICGEAAFSFRQSAEDLT